jgi:hypothetical protein
MTDYDFDVTFADQISDEKMSEMINNILEDLPIEYNKTLVATSGSATSENDTATLTFKLPPLYGIKLKWINYAIIVTDDTRDCKLTLKVSNGQTTVFDDATDVNILLQDGFKRYLYDATTKLAPNYPYVSDLRDFKNGIRLPYNILKIETYIGFTGTTAAVATGIINCIIGIQFFKYSQSEYDAIEALRIMT